MTISPEPDLSAVFDEIPEPSATPGASAARDRVPQLAPSPVRRRVRIHRLAALTASSVWLLIHLAIYGVRIDIHELPELYVVVQVALPFMLAAASLSVAMSSGKLGLGSRIGLVTRLSILGPLAFCLIAIGAPSPYVPAPGAASLLGSLVCFDITVAWTAVPLACAALALSGAFASGARWRSALLGAAVGLFAAATMNLHCSNVAPLHVVLGHGLPVIVATVLGAIALGHRTRA